MNFKFAYDVLFMLCSTTILLSIVVFYSRVVWIVFGGGIIFAGFTLKYAVKWESGFSHWFLITKSLTSVVGVALMNVFRQEGWYTINTHLIVVGLLTLNIAEALIREVQIGFFANAITSIGLILTLPFTPSMQTINRLSIQTQETHCFVFPLHVSWILMYTSWNACFVFGDNMSILTMLILVPPIIMMYFDIELWLSGRVLLLFIHLILRTTQIVWIYRPGHSTLTPVVGTISNSKWVACIWGRINLLVMCVYLYINNRK